MSNSEVNSDQPNSGPCWAVAHIGPSVPGMNAVLYAVVRYAYAKNIRVLAAQNGVEGLRSGQFEQMQWQSVSGLTSPSASVIGSSGLKQMELSDDTVRAVVDNLARNEVKCLCLVGDHTALQLAKLLSRAKVQAKVCFIPACLKPTDDLSPSYCKLGFDSVLNKSCKLLADLGASQASYNCLRLVRLNLAVATCDFVQPSLLALANSAAHCYPSSKVFGSSSQVDTAQVERDASSLKQRMLATGQSQLVLV